MKACARVHGPLLFDGRLKPQLGRRVPSEDWVTTAFDKYGTLRHGELRMVNESAHEIFDGMRPWMMVGVEDNDDGCVPYHVPQSVFQIAPEVDRDTLATQRMPMELRHLSKLSLNLSNEACYEDGTSLIPL